MVDVAEACNRYPSISIDFKIQNPDNILSGEFVVIQIAIEREDEDYTELVNSRYFPKEKEEFWWVVVGDTTTNKLYGLKKINFGAEYSFKMKFIAPEAGNYDFTLIFICDSYLGCEEYETMKVTVLENPDESSEEEEEEEENDGIVEEKKEDENIKEGA